MWLMAVRHTGVPLGYAMVRESRFSGLAPRGAKTANAACPAGVPFGYDMLREGRLSEWWTSSEYSDFKVPKILRQECATKSLAAQLL